MTHQEAWEYIECRLNKPTNNLREQSLDMQKFNLNFHVKRMRDYIINSAHSNSSPEALKLDFETSFRLVKKYMDDEGWE